MKLLKTAATVAVAAALAAGTAMADGHATTKLRIQTHFSPETLSGKMAKKYIEDIRRQIQFAADHPGVGSKVLGLPAEYRKLISGSHRVIYRYTNVELIVVRIIHEREDVPDDINGF